VSTNLEKSVEREKDMQEIDVHHEIKNTVVIAMDGEYAGNAGAIFCHLTGFQHGCCYFANAGCIRA
jgi:hypothetical protein